MTLEKFGIFTYVFAIYSFSFHLSTLQLSFQMWTDEMKESLNTRKKGDADFRDKDFKTAIDSYTQVIAVLCVSMFHGFF